MLFNISIRELFIKETTNCAKSALDDVKYCVRERPKSLYCCAVLAGYHILPQQRLYEKKLTDVKVPSL